MNNLPCRPPRQRVLIADSLPSPSPSPAADADDNHDVDARLPSITTDVDLSDHPLGWYCTPMLCKMLCLNFSVKFAFHTEYGHLW